MGDAVGGTPTYGFIIYQILKQKFRKIIKGDCNIKFQNVKIGKNQLRSKYFNIGKNMSSKIT